MKIHNVSDLNSPFQFINPAGYQKNQIYDTSESQRSKPMFSNYDSTLNVNQQKAFDVSFRRIRRTPDEES